MMIKEEIIMDYFQLLEQKELDSKFIHHNWFKHFDTEKRKYISFKSKKDALRVLAFNLRPYFELIDDIQGLSLSEIMTNNSFNQYGIITASGGSYKLRGIELEFYKKLLDIKKEYDLIEEELLKRKFKDDWIFKAQKENVYDDLLDVFKNRKDLTDALNFKYNE